MQLLVPCNGSFLNVFNVVMITVLCNLQVEDVVEEGQVEGVDVVSGCVEKRDVVTDSEEESVAESEEEWVG